MWLKTRHEFPRKVKKQQYAAMSVFFLVGFFYAAWAPLIPYASDRLFLDEASLSIMLLCFGLGSIITMPITGVLAGRFSCHRVILVASALLAASFPLLAILDHFILMCVVLLLFGGCVGAVDVAANIQASIVQKKSHVVMMPVFHAFYSIGSLTGSGYLIFLLWIGLPVSWAAFSCVLFIAAPLLLFSHSFLHHIPTREERKTAVFPRGIVIVLGLMCFIVYLAEGVIANWSALYMLQYKGFEKSYAALGYSVFVAAVALGRLSGEGLIRTLGGIGRAVFIGSVTAVGGMLLFMEILPGFWAMAGYFLLGFGVSNIVPIIFIAAGSQLRVPLNAAIAAVTTIGYSGTVLGPVIIGLIAHGSSLQTAFWFNITLLVLLAGIARVVFRPVYGLVGPTGK